MENRDNFSYQKILIVNLGGIGDLLLSTPALRALHSAYPKARLTLMVVPRVFEAVKGLPYIQDCVIFPMDKVFFFRNLFSLLALRKRKFDLAVNMRTIVSAASSRKVKFVFGLINPKIKVGRDTEGRGSFFDIRIQEPDIGQKHEMEYDLDTVRILGVDVVDKGIDLEIDSFSAAAVDALLGKAGVSQGSLLIGVHPGGVFSHRWPAENFARVIETLAGRRPCNFLITGTKEEAFLAKKLAGLSRVGLVDLCGRLSLKELGALIKRLNLFISNDTGPMHIAAILKTPLVAIFGPGFLARYDPRALSDKAIVLCKSADCAPCNQASCDSMSCLKVVTVEEAIRAADTLLAQR